MTRNFRAKMTWFLAFFRVTPIYGKSLIVQIKRKDMHAILTFWGETSPQKRNEPHPQVCLPTLSAVRSFQQKTTICSIFLAVMILSFDSYLSTLPLETHLW